MQNFLDFTEALFASWKIVIETILKFGWRDVPGVGGECEIDGGMSVEPKHHLANGLVTLERIRSQLVRLHASTSQDEHVSRAGENDL